MTKGKIIALSIIIPLITLIIVLFSVVFCLRKQNVVAIDDVIVSAEEIVAAAGLENGKSIFMLDKDAAIKNIETKFPEIKVVQIKTTGVTQVDIVVRKRHAMYYSVFAEKYYVFDEELKVLEILNSADDVEPVDLTKIADGKIELQETTKVADFVGTKHQQQVMNNLFKAMYSTVTKTVGEDEVYVEREDIRQLLRTISFESYTTFDKILITTSYGVKLDIENPQTDLQLKINTCFSKIKIMSAEEKSSGTIKIYYDLNNELKSNYIQA